MRSDAYRADGKTTIANAGHLAPYLNGKELAMTGNLPLGLNPSITFDQETIQLKQKDRLLVITDGVIEAKNAKNELFGFNRARSISHLPAAFIVKAAEIFGQEDDITVVSISRVAQEKEGEVSANPADEVRSRLETPLALSFQLPAHPPTVPPNDLVIPTDRREWRDLQLLLATQTAAREHLRISTFQRI